MTTVSSSRRKWENPFRRRLLKWKSARGYASIMRTMREICYAKKKSKQMRLRDYVHFEPLGIVLAIMPWNFPFWQVFRFAAPALMAGNACLLKHASNVPMSALAIEGLFRDAGFPQHILRTLLIGSSLVEEVLQNPLVKAVTLTGSEPAGRHVAEAAASAEENGHGARRERFVYSAG